MLVFNHSGGIGDILYSLYFCKDLADKGNQETFKLHIQTNVKDMAMNMHYHPFGDVRMTEAGANYIKPLLEAQDYIEEVTISDDYTPDSGMINLDIFRKIKINFMSGDIRRWYYNLSKQHLPAEFWRPILSVDVDDTYKDKIILCSTARYQNVFIDYKVLSKFADKFVFFGLESEYEEFKKNNFNLEFYKTIDALDAAKKIVGAKGLCSNQNGIYTIAECLKVPRILISPEVCKFNDTIHPGPHNNHPQGGWNEDVATNDKLVASVEELLNKVD